MPVRFEAAFHHVPIRFGVIRSPQSFPVRLNLTLYEHRLSVRHDKAFKQLQLPNP
jgi:hypothetical protein